MTQLKVGDHTISVVLRDPPNDLRGRHVWSCSCGRSSEQWFLTREAAAFNARKHTR